MGRPWLANLGTKAARTGLALGVPFVERAVKETVFRLFCGGTNLDEAQQTAEKLYASGVQSILDYAVEGEKNEEGFEKTKDNILRTIRHAASHRQTSHCALKMTGLAPFELLEKKHTYQPLTELETAQYARVCQRVEEIVAAGARSGVPVFIDAEESWIQDPVDELAEALMRKYNRFRPMVHTTVQLYLKDRLGYLQGLIEQANQEGFVLGVKLVRGAYLEKENARATELGYDTPTQPTKAATDEAYDYALTLCVANLHCVAVCAATHNIDSVKHLVTEMDRRGIRRDDERVVFSQLLGMLDRLTVPLARQGYNSSKYVPFGEVREVMPYLLRRADENKSVAAQSEGELTLIRQELKRRRRNSQTPSGESR
jgi:proline dehydrogenase